MKPIIGYTAGAFDLFHIGHLNLIKRAKLKCDYLIVGVSTDELIFETKGKHPIIPLEERLEIIQSIKYVDEVIVQSSLDKVEAWNMLKYDILFSGDDWKNSERWMSYKEQLNKVNVEIIYFSYTNKISTSIIKKILYEKFTN
ncbi:MAG: cytidyltransferase-related domain protein [Anaerocolumna sp.]|jgi:glycerol-3-phosphate cytidylyltransferase|nr:cytidyltransferase-related domain protein [Anaerocolumna sp.]